MNNAKEIVVRPLVTEKTLKSQDDNNVVVFQVAKGYNKVAVRKAIEEIYNVKVEKVNIVNTKPKTKRMGRYVGQTSAYKKAYVKLAAGNEIKILADK